MIEKANVATPVCAYKAMEDAYYLIDHLLGGTKLMRDAGEALLPKEPNEKSFSYQVRIARSFLLNFYKDMVNDIVAKPFEREVTLSHDLPELLQPLVDDCDAMGTSLTDFAKNMFREGIAYGKSHILVLHPEDNEMGSDYIKLKKGVRPYFVHVRAVEPIGWKGRAKGNNIEHLSQVRIKTSEVEQDGDWGERIVERVRVYEPGLVTLHEKIKDKWVEIKTSPMSLKDKIPLVTFYTNRTGLLTAEPPLYPVAETELVFWQSYSDQRHILKFSRFAMLFGKGIENEDQRKNGPSVGPDAWFGVESKDADLGYIEPTGEGIKAGERDLADLKDNIEAKGHRVITRKTAQKTATGERVDANKSMSNIRQWVTSAQIAINQALQLAAEWKGGKAKLPDDFTCNIYKDFVLDSRNKEDLADMVKLAMNDKFPLDVLFHEMMRRGTLDEKWDTKQMAKDAQELSLNAGLPTPDPE